MLTSPLCEIVPTARSWQLYPARLVAASGAIATLGMLSIWPTLLALWRSWTSDALQSVGIFVPVVSLILIILAWRRIGWHAEPSWWGVPFLLLAVTLSQVQTRATLLLIISSDWTTPLPPASLPLLAYGVGAILLTGGLTLLRAALFPTMLLWFAKPVPHAFAGLIDLPLQQLSAFVARGFAKSLGQTLTPDNLRLMFTPEFGMFIAPGCNGIRGATTMAFIALIAGYIYHLRWRTNALAVAASVLLGYTFNLVRLCLLVLYYLIALHFPSLQEKAENADYIIGAILFLGASLLLFTLIARFRRKPSFPDTVPPTSSRGLFPLFSLAATAVFGFAQIPNALGSIRSAGHMARFEEFPQHLGDYHLVRTWEETIAPGATIYSWAQYTPAAGGTSVSLGLSPVLGWHDPLVCHIVRGEHPLWQGQLTFATMGPAPVTLSSALYNDGVTQHIEAATECTSDSCRDFATRQTRVGIVYSRISPDSSVAPTADHAIPILLRAEILDASLPYPVAEQQLANDLRGFLASVDLEAITHPPSR